MFHRIFKYRSGNLRILIRKYCLFFSFFLFQILTLLLSVERCLVQIYASLFIFWKSISDIIIVFYLLSTLNELESWWVWVIRSRHEINYCIEFFFWYFSTLMFPSGTEKETFGVIFAHFRNSLSNYETFVRINYARKVTSKRLGVKISLKEPNITKEKRNSSKLKATELYLRFFPLKVLKL